MSSASTKQAIASHLRSHNSGILAASAVALVFSALGWGMLYGASYWMVMLVVAVGEYPEGMPVRFNGVFAATAVLLLLAARLDQWLFPHERAVDERPPIKHIADILFFVPRFTMSCWQNLGALARLNAAELEDAAELLDALKAEGRIPVYAIPAMFHTRRRHLRILNALSAGALIALRGDGSETWITLSPLAPEIFRGPSPAEAAADDPLQRMPMAKVVHRHPRIDSRSNP